MTWDELKQRIEVMTDKERSKEVKFVGDDIYIEEVKLDFFVFDVYYNYSSDIIFNVKEDAPNDEIENSELIVEKGDYFLTN